MFTLGVWWDSAAVRHGDLGTNATGPRLQRRDGVHADVRCPACPGELWRRRRRRRHEEVIIKLSQQNTRRVDKEAGKEIKESKEGSVVIQRESSSCCFCLSGLSHPWSQERCDRRHETPAHRSWLWTEHTRAHTRAYTHVHTHTHTH